MRLIQVGKAWMKDVMGLEKTLRIKIVSDFQIRGVLFIHGKKVGTEEYGSLEDIANQFIKGAMMHKSPPTDSTLPWTFFEPKIITSDSKASPRRSSMVSYSSSSGSINKGSVEELGYYVGQEVFKIGSHSHGHYVITEMTDTTAELHPCLEELETTTDGGARRKVKKTTADDSKPVFKLPLAAMIDTWQVTLSNLEQSRASTTSQQ